MAPDKQCQVVYVYTDLMWLHAFAEYRYIEDLLELDRRRRVPTPDVPPALTSNPSFLSAETWQLSLAEHPDTRLKEYVINGIRDGFQIRYVHQYHACKCAKHNMLSTLEHPEVVHAYIAEECAEEDYWAPLTQPHCHQSRLAGLG